MLDDEGGTVTKYQNGLGIDNKLQSKRGNAVKYFLADHLGSTNGLADATGSLTASQSFDSFGNPTNANFPTRYQFTGREFDSFTGLQFSRARFYDPKLGRFTSEDPIGFAGGDVNLYGYVWNNPLMFRDPEGLFPIVLPLVTFKNPALAKKLSGANPWVGGEVSGGFHIFPLPGPRGTIGIEHNPLTGETCFFVKGSARTGFGYFIGAGAQAGASLGPSSRGESIEPSVDFGADIAIPKGLKGTVSSGGSGSAGLSGLGIGVGPTVGAGFSIGLDGGAKYYFKCYFTPKCDSQ